MITYVLERSGVPWDVRFFIRWDGGRGSAPKPIFGRLGAAMVFTDETEAYEMRDSISNINGFYCRVEAEEIEDGR